MSSPGAGDVTNPSPRPMAHLELGFAHLAGLHRHGGSPIPSPLRRTCPLCIKRFMIAGWDRILSGWRWIHKCQPQPNVYPELGFLRGAVLSGGGALTSPLRWNYTCMEGV